MSNVVRAEDLANVVSLWLSWRPVSVYASLFSLSSPIPMPDIEVCTFLNKKGLGVQERPCTTTSFQDRWPVYRAGRWWPRTIANQNLWLGLLGETIPEHLI